MVESVNKPNVSVVAATVSSSTGFPPSSTGAKNVALTGVSHLQQIEQGADEGASGKLKKGVVAALLGFTLIGAAVAPAHAQDTTQLPQTTNHGLFLDSSQLQQTRYGTTDYDKLFGSQAGSGATTGVIANVQKADVDSATAAAFDVFNARLATILLRDAGSLAAGLRPLQSGDNLTADQQKNMQRAFGDLLQNVPIGAFSPGVQNTLESALGALGDNRDLSNTTLKQLGKLGGDAAKTLVDDFRHEHPAAFWSMAGAGAAAAVVVGYTQGTDALQKLGIKPEIKTSLFDGVKLKAGLEAGKHFSDPRVTVGLEGNHTFQGGTTIKGGISAEVANKTLDTFKVDSAVSTTGGFNADGYVRFDGKGKPFDAHLSASQRFNVPSDFGGGQGVLFANGNWSNGTRGTVDAANLSVGVAAQHGRWTTSVSGNYDFKSDTFSSSLSTGRTFDVNRKNDLDLQIRGSIDNKGNAYVGAGVTFHF